MLLVEVKKGGEFIDPLKKNNVFIYAPKVLNLDLQFLQIEFVMR